MKFGQQIVGVIIVAFILELVLPWWSIAVAAFAMGYFLKSKANFMAGLFGIAFLWAFKAIMLETSSASTLTERVATLFSLSKTLLILITALLGGLVGGFASMAGASLKKEKKRYY